MVLSARSWLAVKEALPPATRGRPASSLRGRPRSGSVVLVLELGGVENGPADALEDLLDRGDEALFFVRKSTRRTLRARPPTTRPGWPPWSRSPPPPSHRRAARAGSAPPPRAERPAPGEASDRADPPRYPRESSPSLRPYPNTAQAIQLSPPVATPRVHRCLTRKVSEICAPRGRLFRIGRSSVVFGSDSSPLLATRQIFRPHLTRE
jgi:hypothetical protein